MSAAREDILSLAVPVGWKLVPVEPTQDMVTAWLKGTRSFQRKYETMLAAAPTPPAAEAPGQEPVADEIEDLLERLDAGVQRNGEAPSEDGMLDLFDIDDANDTMADAASQIRSAVVSAPTKQEPDGFSLEQVKAEIEEGSGIWRTCSGCHDTEDGHPTQQYAYSTAFGCSLGRGCMECGGIGAVWDDTDYDDMVASMLADQAAEDAAPPTYADAEAKGDERLNWFLTILAGMGGHTEVLDRPCEWLTSFCDDRPTGSDTFNIAIERGLMTSHYDGDLDHGSADITSAGREFVAAIRSLASPAKEPGQ